MNCGGINNKLDSLSKLVDSVKPDIVCLTETETRNPLVLRGYDCFVGPDSHLHRVVVLVRTTLEAKLLAAASTVPIVWVETRNAVAGCIYRQFSDRATGRSGLALEKEQIPLYEESLKEAIKLSKGKSMILMGDLNLDWAKREDPTYYRKEMLANWLDISDGVDLSIVHCDTPTWKSYGTHAGAPRTAILDHVYVGQSVGGTRITVREDAFSDHFPVVLTLGEKKEKRVKESLVSLSRRNFKALDEETFLAALWMQTWDNSFCSADPDVLLRRLVGRINVALDSCCPFRTIRVRTDDTLKLAPDTLEMMRSRDKARRTDPSLYRQLRNKAGKLIKRDRIRSTLEELKRDPHYAWKLASPAVGNTLPVLDNCGSDEESARNINEFFCTKAENIRKVLDMDNRPPHVPVPLEVPPPELSFGPTDEDEVSRLINGLGNTSALGEDGIPTRAIKLGKRALSGPIAVLVNASLKLGMVPEAFKLSTVVPVYKRGSRTTVDNYRPVAIVDALSKLLEAVVLERLRPHLELVLPQEQHGFRPNRGVTTAVADLLQHALSAKRRGETVVLVAYDFSSAFDCTAADPLTAEAEAIGLQPAAIKWLANWLTGRKQRTRWNGALSPLRGVRFGIPQGTRSGPALFAIVTRSLPYLFRSIGEAQRPTRPIEPATRIGALLQIEWEGMDKFVADGATSSVHVYADDFTSCVGSKWPAVAVCVAERLAIKFAAAANSIGLAMSAAKTQMLMSGGRKKLNSMSVEGSTIQASDHIKILGVEIDRALSTAPHLAGLKAATRRRAGIVKRLSYSLPRRQLQEVAIGFVFGKIRATAALAVSARLELSAPPSAAEVALQREINSLARVLTRARRTDRVRIPDLLSRAGLPSLNEVAVQSAALLAWSASNPLHPAHRDVHVANRPVASRARAGRLLRVPEKGNTAYFSAVLAWNASTDLRAASTLGAAKRIARLIARKAPL